MASDAGTHAVILTAFELSKLAEVSSGLAETLSVDIKTANSILQHTPIVVFDSLDQKVAEIVVKNMKHLTDAGCKFKVAAPPLETQRKMRWPKPHKLVVEARQEALEQSGIARNDDGTFTVECPKCMTGLTISLVGPVGSEKLVITSGTPAAPKVSPKEVEKKLESVPAQKPPAPTGMGGFMELDEFEAGLAELETDHGLMKPPASPSEASIPVADFEEMEEVPLEPTTDPHSGDSRMEIDTNLEAAIRELDDGLPDVPEVRTPKRAPTGRVGPLAKPPTSRPARAVSKKDPTEIPKGGGPAAFSVILPQIRSEKKRGEAAVIIAQVLKIPEEDALELTNRLIITVARDITEAQAEKVKAVFEQHGFKARVTKKK